MIGIYKITNTVDNTSYIGKSKDLKTRLRKHKYRLNHGIHHNKFLQRAWDKYGTEFFVFEILEECEIEELDIRETYYIYTYNSFHKGFNMSVGGEGCPGYKHSQEVKSDMQARNRGKKNPYSRKVACGGQIFDTMRDCANYYNINEKTMQKWLSGYRNTREEFKSMRLRYLE